VQFPTCRSSHHPCGEPDGCQPDPVVVGHPCRWGSPSRMAPHCQHRRWDRQAGSPGSSAEPSAAYPQAWGLRSGRPDIAIADRQEIDRETHGSQRFDTVVHVRWDRLRRVTIDDDLQLRVDSENEPQASGPYRKAATRSQLASGESGAAQQERCARPTPGSTRSPAAPRAGPPGSHSGHPRGVPNLAVRPSCSITQGRSWKGGRWRTCWVWPQDSSATQSPSASRRNPVIERSTFSAYRAGVACHGGRGRDGLDGYPMEVGIARVYDCPGPGSARLVLVDRLWPRGVSKPGAPFQQWMKEVAPSPALRTWYGHEPERFEEFARRYRDELTRSPAREALEELRMYATGEGLILVTATRDVDHSAAAVLREVLADG
jgi:uncharacterized protein YeaO (DUF488 family)